MNPPPPGWPRISSSLYYNDALQAIEWLCAAFGFTVRLQVDGDDGSVRHSQLVLGDDGLIMVSSAQVRREQAQPFPGASPQSLDCANTQSLCVYVDNVDAHFERARAAGATIGDENQGGPTTTDYGEEFWADRGYRAQDPEGHQWWFVQRVRGPGAV